jgi:hypothetical protein
LLERQRPRGASRVGVPATASAELKLQGLNRLDDAIFSIPTPNSCAMMLVLPSVLLMTR